jgi:hypothetical protein
MENNILVGGMRLVTHDRGTCKGEYCTIHNFSDHHMVRWNQNWREERGVMERICGHGVGHLDPDEVDGLAKLAYQKTHGCDGCCNPASQFDKDLKELTKQYKKPDYITPTSIGPVSTGTTSTLEMYERLLLGIESKKDEEITA